MANFDIAVAKTLIKEGGGRYTETKADRGGGTKYGISSAAYPNLDIKSLTEEQAREIYRTDYWLSSGANQLVSQELAESLFDFAVNAGPATAKRLFAIAEPEATPEENLLARFTLLKIIRYTHICNKDKTQERFLRGWLNRSIGGTQ